jgi:hypothetical protein
LDFYACNPAAVIASYKKARKAGSDQSQGASRIKSKKESSCSRKTCKCWRITKETNLAQTGVSLEMFDLTKNLIDAKQTIRGLLTLWPTE